MTTSLPSVEEGAKATSIGLDVLLTDTSWVSKPMEEKTSTNGGCFIVVSRKLPLSSVKVPAAVPFTTTDTAGTLSFVAEWRTVPVIVEEDWEKAGKEKIQKRKIVVMDSGVNFCLIAQVFG